MPEVTRSLAARTVRLTPVRLVLAAVIIGLAPPLLESSAASRRDAYQPKIALDAHAIAFARRASLRLRDLPSGWAVNLTWKPGLINQTGPELDCFGHVADLSAVTFKGGWTSRFDLVSATRIWELISAVIVLATPNQARANFDATNVWLTRYCFVQGTTRQEVRYTSVRRVPVAAVADQQAEVRIRKVQLAPPKRRLGEALIELRRGPVMISLTFEWAKTAIPTQLIDAIVRKLAGRATP
jgi:hypothetical protein